MNWKNIDDVEGLRNNLYEPLDCILFRKLGYSYYEIGAVSISGVVYSNSASSHTAKQLGFTHYCIITPPTEE